MLQQLAINAVAFRDSKLKDIRNEERRKKEAKTHKKERSEKGLEKKNNDTERRKVQDFS